MIYDELAAVLGDPLAEHFGDDYWAKVDAADVAANFKPPQMWNRPGSVAS
jgi:hypothetical protein